MKLTTAEVARRLDLPTSTVERWIRQGRIPAHRRGEEWLFELGEVAEWADSHNLPFADSITDEREPEPQSIAIDLVQTMRRGGLHFGVEATDAASALAAAAALVPLPSVAQAELLDRLLARERLSSTGIGNGIAIPHPRNPLGDAVGDPIVTTCFLARPVEFGAVDGQPVFLLFTLLAPTVGIHLQLLSKLAFCLRNEAFAAVLAEVPAGDRFWTALASSASGLERR